MKRASDFRRIARNALRGNWCVAVLTAFVASILGVTYTAGSGGISFGGSSSSGSTANEPLTTETLEKILPILIILLVVLLIFLAALLIYSIVIFIISGAGRLGYATFNLNLIDGKRAQFSDLFSQFKRFGDGLCMNLLVGLYTFLWTLLLIVPGIIKRYSYAMTPYILAECPGISANDAITKSKIIMDGNKWRLFCLDFSFIGWSLLCTSPIFVLLPLILLGPLGMILWLMISLPTISVSNLFLVAYQEAARAAFYREVSYTVASPSHTDVQACTKLDA